VLADRGYHADWIRQFVREQGAWANAAPKKNRTSPINFSPDLYRLRFFNKIKQCWRIATRYDKLAANYLASSRLPRSRSGYGRRPQGGLMAHEKLFVTKNTGLVRAAN
jgi:transposase